MLPRLPVLIGVMGMGALATTGSWFKRQADERQQAEVRAVQSEVAGMKEQATQYWERFENLRWNAAKLHATADGASSEPLKTWARERAKKFEGLVAHIEQAAGDTAFQTLAREIEELCARGQADQARARSQELRPPRFPSAEEFRELHAELYLQPLASFSRQNPAYYRAFQAHEPEAALAEIAALRAELAAAEIEAITPQALVKFELLSAVAPATDPVLADWAALASAADYFEKPDAPTLKRWREANQALRVGDWPTAVARMQAITLSTVRTRQPFRAAYGRAIIKNSPDETAEAYPFMQEAARAGDGAARSWVAQEDLAARRYGEALRWLEASVNDGDASAVAPLLSIYAMDTEAVPRDREREAGLLQRITVGPDAPELSWMLLARLYESGEGLPRSLEKAFTCYLRAGEKQSVSAWVETARCHLRGSGTPVDLDRARDWAIRAYAAGERERSVPMLVELMQRAPDRTASRVQELFANETVAAPAGFEDIRIGGTSVSQLRMQVAKFLEQKGAFGAAARLYAQSGSDNVAAAHRHAELTAVLPCEPCGGEGKIHTSIACPTCGGKGTVTCSGCDGRGYSLIPGTPPCTTCGGSGGIMQESRRVACSVCAGSGKGKGSVIKQPCGQCSHGRASCRECVSGRIKVTKVCVDCRGVGSRALADQ